MKTLVFLFCFALVGCSCTEAGRLARKPVISVNEATLSTQEFADRLAMKLKDFDALQAKDEATLNRSKQSVVDEFIIETLILKYAEQNSVLVTNQELEGEITKIRARYPDDLAFRRMLAQQNLAYERWKEGLEKSLIQQKVRAKIANQNPEPKEQDLRAFYEQQKNLFHRPARVQLRQIVTDKEDNARRIYDELRAGKDFSRLAREFSLGPEASDGGKTGWIEKGALEVFDQAFKLGIGARSKVIQSPYGFHIYEVLKKEPEARLSFNEAKAKIKALLKERQDQEAFMKWLETELKASKVMRDDQLINAVQVTTRGS